MFGVDELLVDPRVATFPIRAIARILDIVVALGVGIVSPLIAIIVLAAQGQPGDPAMWIQRMGGLSLIGFVVGWIGSTFYHSLSEWVGGASVGKLVCGLRVVSEEFAPVSFRGAFIRSAVFPLDGFLLGLIGYRSMKRSALAQRVGDRWGRTTVVRSGAFPGAARGAARVLFGLFLGLTAWVSVGVLLFVVRVGNAV